METTSNPHQFKIFKHHHIKDMIRPKNPPRHENITHKKLNRVEAPYFKYAIILISEKTNTPNPPQPTPPGCSVVRVHAVPSTVPK